MEPGVWHRVPSRGHARLDRTLVRRHPDLPTVGEDENRATGQSDKHLEAQQERGRALAERFLRLLHRSRFNSLSM